VEYLERIFVKRNKGKVLIFGEGRLQTFLQKLDPKRKFTCALWGE